MKKEQLTVIIPTKEDDLDISESAIKSVQWANEILVVDSSFSNKVKKLSEKWGAKYFQHKYVYSAKQKNWIIPQAKNEWILLLDSDEVVTDKLRNTIKNLLDTKEMDKYDGFGIARKHFFFGKFLRWGGRYPLYNIRLFKKTCRYEDRDVHAHIILDKNKVSKIKPRKGGDILHFSDRNFDQFFERFNRYSTYQANYMKKISDKETKIKWFKFFTNFYYFKAIIKDIWFFVPGTSLFRFVYMYIVRLGFLDGRDGFMIALLYGFQDYVSKTKYYFLIKRDAKFRYRLQGFVMKNVISFSNLRDKNNSFVQQYEKKLAAIKN